MFPGFFWLPSWTARIAGSIFLQSCLLLLLPAGAGAAAVSLKWGASPSANVGGYKLYYGTASRQYSANVDAGTSTAYTLDGLADGVTYYFAVTAYNTARSTESAFSNEVSQGLPALTATITASVSSGAAPLDVSLTPAVTGTVTAWEWDFGDTTGTSGSSVPLPNATHRYNAAGTFTARLTVHGPSGQVVRSVTIRVTPTAQFEFSADSGTVPATIPFTDSSTGAPDEWTWDFGDGQASDQENPSHTYTAAGTYTVSLKVKGGGVSSDNVATHLITVTAAEAPLTASLGAQPANSGTAPFTVTFTPTIGGNAASLDWDFGDGEVRTATTAAAVTKTYTQAGVYRAKLKANGIAAAAATASILISVSPKASFSASVTSGVAPLQVRFTDTSTGSPDRWAWDFGDNTQSEQQNPTHTFTASGIFPVTLRTTDSTGGMSATATGTIAVDLDAGLVAAFAFDESGGILAADASGNGNAAAISNASWTTRGKYGAGLMFNGSDTKLTVKDAYALQLKTGMTLEAWIKPSTVDESVREVIYKGDQTAAGYYLAATSRNASKPVSGVRIGEGEVQTQGRSRLPKNSWTHLAATYDGETLRFYVNGREKSAQAQPGGLATTAGDLEIGGNSLAGSYFRGLIDEVRIYNHALSAAEIKNDRATSIGRSNPPLSLAGSDGAGNSTVAIRAGEARAFGSVATATGLVTELAVQLDRKTETRQFIAGIYADNGGQPGNLLTKGVARKAKSGRWYRLPVAAAAVAAGTPYWIAILNPDRGHDTDLILLGNESPGETTANSAGGLSDLPSQWSGAAGNDPAPTVFVRGYIQ